MPKTLGIWEWGCPKRGDAQNAVTPAFKRKRGNSTRASPTPHHTLNEERRARFTAQPLSALIPRLRRRKGENRYRTRK